MQAVDHPEDVPDQSIGRLDARCQPPHLIDPYGAVGNLQARVRGMGQMDAGGGEIPAAVRELASRSKIFCQDGDGSACPTERAVEPIRGIVERARCRRKGNLRLSSIASVAGGKSLRQLGLR